jgi:hypothetical protein
MPVPINTDMAYGVGAQPWSSMNTPTGPTRQDQVQQMKMSQAVWSASPQTPSEALRRYAPTNVMATSATASQPTLDDVLGQYAGSAPQMSIFDYSGSASGGGMASTAPSISLGS